MLIDLYQLRHIATREEKVLKRRNVGILLVLVSVLVITSLSGCSGGAKNQATGGGTLTFAQPLDPTGLDPAIGNDVAATNLYAVIYDTLVMYAPGETLKLSPGLAETWDISTDGLTYTFHLRQGVKFTDGTPFNADAVKFNLDRQLDTTNQYHDATMTYAATLFGQLKSYRVVDENTFEMVLKQPFAGFLDQLTSYTAAAIASPTAIQKYGKDFFKNPVGTGPFIFSAWQPDTEIDFLPNKDYWGGAPKLDKLICRTIPESATQLAELKAGTIDFTNYGLNPNDVEQVAGDPNLTLKSLPALDTYMIHFRSWKKPFNDLRLRQAVAYAINKQNIVDYVLKGRASPATGAMPKASWSWYPTDDYPYNPDKAKELLAQAGYPKGGLTVSLLTNPNMAPAAQAIQADLAAVGITANIQQSEGGAYWDQLPTEVGDMIMDNWWLPNGDPDYLMSMFYATKNIATKSNVDRYSNPEVDQLLDQAAVETNQAKRAELYNQIQKITDETAPMVFIYYQDNQSSYRNVVQGLQFTPIGVYFNQASIQQSK